MSWYVALQNAWQQPREAQELRNATTGPEQLPLTLSCVKYVSPAHANRLRCQFTDTPDCTQQQTQQQQQPDTAIQLTVVTVVTRHPRRK